MSWLSLTVSGPGPNLGKKLPINPVKISTPKKGIRLATRRNRLRRLIKEALRLEFSLEKEKNYTFRVEKDPGDIGLGEAKEAIHALWPR